MGFTAIATLLGNLKSLQTFGSSFDIYSTLLQNCLPGHLLCGDGDQGDRQGLHLEQLHLPEEPMELARFHCHTLRQEKFLSFHVFVMMMITVVMMMMVMMQATSHPSSSWATWPG